MTIVTLGLYLAVVSTPSTIFGDISIQNNPVTQENITKKQQTVSINANIIRLTLLIFSAT